MGAFGITGNVIVSGMGAYIDTPRPTKGDADGYDGATLAINLIPTYDLDFATVGLSLGMKMSGIGYKDPKGDKRQIDGDDASSVKTDIGFGGFIKKDVGNGNIRLGLAYTLGTIETYADDGGKAKTGILKGGTFSIPVLAEFWF
jgi:hypothetical protein